MRILLVTQYYSPEPFIIAQMVEELSQQGHTVSVLTGKPNYPDGRIPAGYSTFKPSVETLNGVDVHRVPIVPRGRAGAARLTLNYLSFVVSADLFGRALIRRQMFDVVFVYAPSPILQAVPAIRIARSRGIPVVLWVQDLWPESLSATGRVSNRRIIGQVQKWVRWIYRNCTKILVQSKAFVEPVIQAGADPADVAVLHNPANRAASAQALPPDAQKLADAIDTNFTVLFTGNIGDAQGLDVVLEAARLLEREIPVRFQIVGDGLAAEDLRRKLNDHGPDNVSLPGRFPAEAMGAFYAGADALLLTLRDDPIFRKTVPSKLQGYLAAGRPVIASITGEAARVVEEAGAGFTAKAGDGSALADAVRKMYRATKSERDAMGCRARSYFESNYDSELVNEALVAYLHDAIETYRAAKRAG